VKYSKLITLLACIVLFTVKTTAQLTANFTTDKPGGCSPLAISCTNTSTGASANAIYTWDLGNGNTSASFNAGAIYKDEQTYTITLTIKDGAQTAVKTKTVTVYAKPQVNDITVSPLKGCLPLNAVFTADASPGSGTLNGYFWDFGDGNTQQGYSPSQQHVYNVAQKATVGLTITNSFGCTNTFQKKDIVEIIPAIGASFSASQTILCRETDAVQFTNNSFGPGTLSYQWDFGDGTTSTIKAPSHSFNKKGIYTVKLTVTSSEGCIVSNTQAGYINVASFSSDFSAPSLICKNSYLTFNSNSNPYPASSSWEVDGVPVYYYSNYLNYTFSTIGNHSIKLKNIFGTCPDSAVKTLSVKDIPYPNGFVDTIMGSCGAPVAVHFKDTTVGAVQWQWNFNSSYYGNIDATAQAPVHTYTGDGGYYTFLTVFNADGCSASTSKYIGITRPSVSINASGNRISCGPFKLTFAANATEELTSYDWRFSDGGSSTEMQPEHVFSAQGYYTVTLTYTTRSGCSGTVSYGDIQVYSKPVADFAASATTICGNTPVLFTAKYQGNDVGYHWYFGDETYNFPSYSFNNPNFSHQYNYDSAYSVMLIVENLGGCRDTMTRKEYIKVLPPFPKISGYTNTCDGTRGLVTFTQASKKAETWTWDFGDGAVTNLTVDQPSITHTYANTGYHKTVLSVTNGTCTVRDSTTAIVLLKQNPVFTIDKNDICSNEWFGFKINNIEFNPTPYNYSNNYNYISWEYADGSRFNGNFYNFDYWTSNTAGSASSYNNVSGNIRVIFQSAHFMCYDTTNFVTLKFKGATAGFTVAADKQCWRQPVVFVDTSKATGSSKIVNWTWNFGDGSSQRFQQGGTAEHRYNNPGTYNVSLTITDAGGCVSTISASRYIEVSGPKAAFSMSASNTTITLPVYFYNYTNNYNSYNTAYQWDFGDGSTSTDYYPVHAYNIPGDYTVRLIATNPVTLCGDTAYQQIKILNFAPAFAFSSSNVTGKCPPVLARFSNNSFNYTRVSWDFGDGITADNLNYPSHVYENPGKYIITLFVYGPGGLQATYTDSVMVRQPSATVFTDTTELCVDGKATLTAGSANTKNYLWDFGDGILTTGTDSIASHIYHTAGNYTPAVMVGDANGCAVLTTLNTAIHVHANPIINFSPAQPVVCKGSGLQITASGGSVYEWTPATGLNNANIASPVASPGSDATYTVLVKDDIGCKASTSLKVTVAQPFVIKAPDEATLCLGKSMFLSVNGAPNYKWIDNTVGLSNTQSSRPVVMPVVSTVYTVVGMDQYNCFTDTARVKINVVPLPVVNAGADQEVQLAAPVQLSSTTDNDVVQWNWTPASYLSCSDCPAPLSTPLAQTAYVLTVTNKNGCTASDTVIIKVQCEESTIRIPNAFTPNNDNNNDRFVIKGISLVKHLVIFGRWGEKVFERSNFIAGDRSSCWDGTYKGNLLPAGSYIYYAEMQCPAGGIITRKGSVVLIR
jgi:gliding motility-associated-like protein